MVSSGTGPTPVPTPRPSAPPTMVSSGAGPTPVPTLSPSVSLPPTILTSGTSPSMPPTMCEVKSFDVPKDRSACVAVIQGDEGKYGVSFEMDSEFINDCKCCEYRQFVRGQFKFSETGNPLRNINHRLCGANMNNSTFQEDCLQTSARTYRYGHREDVEFSNDIYTTTRPDGCKYDGFDFPGLAWNVSYNGQITLDFKAQIVDVCVSPNTVKNETTWDVDCGPSTITVTQPVTMAMMGRRNLKDVFEKKKYTPRLNAPKGTNIKNKSRKKTSKKVLKTNSKKKKEREKVFKKKKKSKKKKKKKKKKDEPNVPFSPEPTFEDITALPDGLLGASLYPRVSGPGQDLVVLASIYTELGGGEIASSEVQIQVESSNSGTVLNPTYRPPAGVLPTFGNDNAQSSIYLIEFDYDGSDYVVITFTFQSTTTQVTVNFTR
eukprot:scaffold45593_cov191-Amphora_coffeaeformis.AAC.1